MADNERKSTILSQARLPDGTTVIERETSTGQTQYVRRGDGISGEQFISPDVGEGLKQTTELGNSNVVPGNEGLTQEELQDFGINVDAETVRQNRIENKYTKINETENLERRTLEGGDSKEQVRKRRIKAFMNNDVIRKEVDNDPLIETNKEKKRAIESYSKQLIEELENAGNRTQERRVLREYGFDLRES
jgi:hypothetical protein